MVQRERRRVLTAWSFRESDERVLVNDPLRFSMNR